MFKRANKVTALLVAAASIMSVVPAMAASGRLAVKEGHIEKAVMFKDGKYVYQGYREDGDSSSLYYNAGDKDKEIDELSEGTILDTAKYSTGSVVANDEDGDEYLIDLATGKSTDEDGPEDSRDTLEGKLKNKLLKTDRYEDVDDFSLTKVMPGQFGDVWYQYMATTSGASSKKYYGYTDKDGKYVDASKDAKLYVFNGHKMIKIDKFDDDFKDGVKATIDDSAEPVVVGQDKDFLYRLIKVKFTVDSDTTIYFPYSKLKYDASDAKKKDAISQATIPATVEGSKTGRTSGNAANKCYYVQKISKAQGSDKEDDAYLPKTTETYSLRPNTDGIYNWDYDMAVQSVRQAAYDMGNKNTTVGSTGTDDYGVGKTCIGSTIVDGELCFTLAGSTSAVVIKVKLNKTMKFDTADVDSGKAVSVNDYVAKQNANNSHDMKGINAVSLDANGNSWVIDAGKLFKSEKGGGFSQKYTCDRSLDSLDVYDDTSLIAWKDGGDVYTTFKEGTKEAEQQATSAVEKEKPAVVAPAPAVVNPAPAVVNPAPAVVTPKPAVVAPVVTVKAGWNKAANGTWTYLDATGAKTVSKWIPDGAKWYYLGADGVMKTSAWVQYGADWYYVGTDGAMLTSQYVGSYWVNGSGAWVK